MSAGGLGRQQIEVKYGSGWTAGNASTVGNTFTPCRTITVRAHGEALSGQRRTGGRRGPVVDGRFMQPKDRV